MYKYVQLCHLLHFERRTHKDYKVYPGRPKNMLDLNINEIVVPGIKATNKINIPS